MLRKKGLKLDTGSMIQTVSLTSWYFQARMLFSEECVLYTRLIPMWTRPPPNVVWPVWSDSDSDFVLIQIYTTCNNQVKMSCLCCKLGMTVAEMSSSYWGAFLSATSPWILKTELTVSPSPWLRLRRLSLCDIISSLLPLLKRPQIAS